MSKYRVFSADNHIIEAPNCFVDHVPAAYKERAPRIVRAADGGDGWSFNGEPPKMTFGINALAGRTYENYKASGLKLEEILPGNYDGAAHLKDMEHDGVDGAVIFPMAALETWSMADRTLAQVLMRAYNDWLVEDFCAADPSRLMAIAMMPVDDGMEGLLAEFERTVKKGAKGVMLPYYPAKPYYDHYYDPFWKAAQDASIPVHIHRVQGGKPPAVGAIPGIDQKEGLAVSGIVQRFFAATTPFANLVYTGLFERFPKLKFVAAEVNGGWLPFWMQMMEQEYERQRHWAKLPLKRPPSEFMGRNLFVTVLDDFVYFDACKRDPKLAAVGMFSTDYPHSVTLYPKTREYIRKLTDGLDPKLSHDILVGNAVRIYNLSA